MSKSTYHLKEQEIPEGLQIFAERLEVAGVSFRKADATAFALSKDGWLEFEKEPGNSHDRNAIRIIGCSKGFLGTKRRFIGYVPKQFSKMIVEGGFFSRHEQSLQLRPLASAATLHPLLLSQNASP
jgi:hypothetical protein